VSQPAARLPEAVKGTADLLPPDGERVLAVRAGLAAPLRLAGYGYVEPPLLELTELFARGVGETTDVVSKEMFSFTDRGGRLVTLRPEGTVGVVRAALAGGLQRGALPVKLFYDGPMFRYEQPQAGRQRQFGQVGAEALGSEDPALDAELVQLADAGFRGLGLTRTVLQLNSLGDPEDRAAYSATLRDWLRDRVGGLDAETDGRIERNPLRVLDDKRPEVRERTADAPLVTGSLSAQAQAHHDAVRRHLADLGVAYVDEPRLVRGLDYYRRTTFEFVHPLLGAQSTIGAGGRYDGLAESIGGPPLPGVGWASGVERVLLALAAEQVEVAVPAAVAAYVGALDPRATDGLVVLLARLRAAGVRAEFDYGREGRGVGKFLAAAGRAGARVAVFVGAAEHDAGVVAVRDLVSREQRQVPPSDVPALVQGLTA